MKRVKYIFTVLCLSMLVACASTQSSTVSTYNGDFSDRDEFFDDLITELAYTENQKNLITFGKKYLGSRYVFGAEDPNVGFDCSGFTQYVYKNGIDMELPRTSKEMQLVGTPIYNKNKLEAGDLVFFNFGGRNSSHVGIYIGNGKFFQASPSQGKIVIGNMKNDYFSKRFSGARRVLANNS